MDPATTLNRSDADPERVAVLLPGGGYTAAMPLLYFARAVLQAHGWTTINVGWHPPADTLRTSRWVGDQLSGTLATVDASRVLVVGKSLGTLAALSSEAPAVWLTPLLARDQTGQALGAGLVEAMAASPSPAMLVGGTADPWWDGEQARSTGKQILEIEGVGHNLEHPHVPRRSVETLGRIVAVIDDFVAALA